MPRSSPKRKPATKPPADEPGESPDPQDTAEFRAQIAEQTTDEKVANRVGVSVSTLKRWVKAGAIPQYDGTWTTAAVAHARIVGQLRKTGQPLEEIVNAAKDGRLALGGADALFAVENEQYTIKEAARAAGIKLAVAEQIWLSLGMSIQNTEHVTEQDVEALKRVREVLDAGVPLGAVLQIVRVAAKAFADIADAEARLMRMYVHEPLLQRGTEADKVSEVMGEMITNVLPHISPLFEYMHSRYLQGYAEQVQIENVQGTGVKQPHGRLNVVTCFVDIAGFTRFTEEMGVEKAFEQTDHLRQHIETTLPDSARMVKLTGDGAMVVGSDPGELARWAVALSNEDDHAFQLRIGMDFGEVLYRDGDYFGGTINMAARVLNRSDAGEVLATRWVKDEVNNRSFGLRFVSIGNVRLKGFDDVVELFRVEQR
jgi:adenylate cyclase